MGERNRQSPPDRSEHHCRHRLPDQGSLSHHRTLSLALTLFGKAGLRPRFFCVRDSDPRDRISACGQHPLTLGPLTVRKGSFRITMIPNETWSFWTCPKPCHHWHVSPFVNCAKSLATWECPSTAARARRPLVDEVAQRQQKRGGDLKAIEAELNAPAVNTSDTRVVFLPRDPQWAYVFWEISDEDRKVAQKDGASTPVSAPCRRHRHAGRQRPPAHPSRSPCRQPQHRVVSPRFRFATGITGWNWVTASVPPGCRWPSHP